MIYFLGKSGIKQFPIAQITTLLLQPLLGRTHHYYKFGRMPPPPLGRHLQCSSGKSFGRNLAEIQPKLSWNLAAFGRNPAVAQPKFSRNLAGMISYVAGI